MSPQAIRRDGMTDNEHEWFSSGFMAGVLFTVGCEFILFIIFA